MNHLIPFAKVRQGCLLSALLNLLLMSSWTCLVGVPSAWSSVTGSISGTVKDPSGAVIAGATVSVSAGNSAATVLPGFGCCAVATPAMPSAHAMALATNNNFSYMETLLSGWEVIQGS